MRNIIKLLDNIENIRILGIEELEEGNYKLVVSIYKHKRSNFEIYIKGVNSFSGCSNCVCGGVCDCFNALCKKIYYNTDYKRFYISEIKRIR